MKDNTKRIAYDLKKIRTAMEKFGIKYASKLDDKLGLYGVMAIVKDRGIFLSKVKYDLNELSLNVTSVEKYLITKKLADKYKVKDKEEQKDQKRLITKQLKDIRNGRRAKPKANRISKAVQRS